VLENPTQDRRTQRHEATKAEILAAAWELVRAEGLAALSLRDLARKVGMQAPSLYQYFESKHAIYDAMFAQGYRELLDTRVLSDPPETSDPAEWLKQRTRVFLRFCLADSARYQLMFQRTIPRFEPSPASYAVSVAALEEARAALASIGLTEPAQLDLWTALTTGLADQQISNDPGGDRWIRLIDDAIDMFLNHVQPTRRKRK
jgi:AcrR family transcriptional regulator